MPKGGKSSGDYEGWFLRMIDRAEDLSFAMDKDEWIEFCESKVMAYREAQGVEETATTGSQRSRYEELRELAMDFQRDIGLRSERLPRLAGSIKHRYRDLTGEFGRKGAWVSAKKIQGRIMAEVAVREAEIKRKKYKTRGY